MQPAPMTVTDDHLEAEIDAVGREKVFALMRENGWGPMDTPPKWVWWEACAQVRAALGREG